MESKNITINKLVGKLKTGGISKSEVNKVSPKCTSGLSLVCFSFSARFWFYMT